MIGEETELKVLHQSGDEMDAYERLIGDAMRGDSTLFARQDAVEAQWQIIDSILGTRTPLYEYERGTWGPPRADQIAGEFGGWHNPS
jgi:glucose-6-phosphate 1-dehydrogenase